MRISLQNNRWRLYILQNDRHQHAVQLWCGMWSGGVLVGFNLGIAVKSSSFSPAYLVYGVCGRAEAVRIGDVREAIAELVQQGLRALESGLVAQFSVHAMHEDGASVTVLPHAVPDAYYIDSWAGMPYCARRRA